jgi:hypothetical protein
MPSLRDLITTDASMGVVAALVFAVAPGYLYAQLGKPGSRPDSNASCIERIEMPQYPPLATAAKAEGTVTARVLLGSQGRVQEIKTDPDLTYASDEELLVSPVENAVRQSVFHSNCSGKTVTVVFRFWLIGNLSDHPNQSVSFTAPNIFWITSERHRMESEAASRLLSLQSDEYTVSEAYAVYASILGGESPVGGGALSLETEPYQMCLKPKDELDTSIREAMVDYIRVNRKSLILLPGLFQVFPVAESYRLVRKQELKSDALGRSLRTFSAVGFNRDRTVALAYYEHSGNRTGSGAILVLHKVDGKWMELAQRAMCRWIS